jgi:hypothetical protein
MKAKARATFFAIVGMILFSINTETRGQVFWLGFNGGATHSWFSSPEFDNLLTDDTWGWNFGFFTRFGKRPFYQAGVSWTRAQSPMKIYVTDNHIIEDQVSFNNFDVMVKTGYEIIRRPIFKWHVNGGPFIGTSFLFGTSTFEIEDDDMRNPQFGLAGGTGFQFMNLIFDVDYQQHLTDLFTEDEIGGGTDFDSHLHHITLKAGFIF